VPRAEPIAVWLNDRYLGLYLLVEPIDNTFFRRRGDASRQLYKARDLLATLAADSDVAAAFSVRIGSDEFTDLKHLIHLLHLPPGSESRAALARLVNADNVARYMAAAALVNHWDGIINNYYLARTDREPGFSMHPWDLDQTFEGIVTSESAFFRKNALMDYVINDEAGYDSYREALGQLGQVTTAESMAMLIDDHANRIREAYQQDPLLGGAGESLENHAAWLKQRAVRQQQWFEP
jgi:spore coat protein CotH